MRESRRKLIKITSVKIKIVDHDYKVGDKVVRNNRSAYIYETPYNGPFEIIQKWTNDTVALKTDKMKIRSNICRIKTYKTKTNIDNVHL